MASERISDPALQGIGTALRRAIPLAGHDKEEREERQILRRYDLKERVQ